jgi:hypothetical protein
MVQDAQGYCIARITPEGVIPLRRCETYSEADSLFDHYAEQWSSSIVEIFPNSAIKGEQP